MIIKPKKWIDTYEQTVTIGNEEWRVQRLWVLSKDFKIFDLPIAHINMRASIGYDDVTARELVMHFKAAQAADLSYPVILGEDGELLDGRHRIMKAIMEGIESVKAVRFEENPRCDWRTT